jgi:hypothetical protein
LFMYMLDIETDDDDPDGDLDDELALERVDQEEWEQDQAYEAQAAYDEAFPSTDEGTVPTNDVPTNDVDEGTEIDVPEQHDASELQAPEQPESNEGSGTYETPSIPVSLPEEIHSVEVAMPSDGDYELPPEEMGTEDQSGEQSNDPEDDALLMGVPPSSPKQSDHESSVFVGNSPEPALEIDVSEQASDNHHRHTTVHPEEADDVVVVEDDVVDIIEVSSSRGLSDKQLT